MNPSSNAPANPETAPAPVKRRFGGAMLLAAIAAVLVAVPFTLLTVAVRGSYGPLHRVDVDVARSLNRQVLPRHGLVDALDVIATVGAPNVWRGVAALIGIGLWWRGRRLLAVWLAVTMATGGLLGVGLKELVARTRPSLSAPVARAAGYSFPSGHALNSMLFFACLIVIVYPLVHGAARVLLWAGSALVVLAIGLDRVALGVHYTSDVLGGWIIALATTAATAAGFNLWRREEGLPAASMVGGLEPEHEPDAGGAGGSQRRSLTARPSPPGGPDPAPPTGWGVAVRRIVAGLLWRWAVLLAVMAAIGMLITRVAEHLWPLTVEDGINRQLAAHRTSLGDSLTHYASGLGETLPIITLCALAAVVLRIALHRWRESVFLISATAGVTVVFLLTALVIDRHRPGVRHLDIAPPTSSFPSGHSGASTALYVGLAIVAHRHIRNPWLRRLVIVLLVVLPLLVGLARLYRGMHHPTDVLAGYLNGALILATTDRLLRSTRLPDDQREGPNP